MSQTARAGLTTRGVVRRGIGQLEAAIAGDRVQLGDVAEALYGMLRDLGRLTDSPDFDPPALTRHKRPGRNPDETTALALNLAEWMRAKGDSWEKVARFLNESLPVHYTAESLPRMLRRRRTRGGQN